MFCWRCGRCGAEPNLNSGGGLSEFLKFTFESISLGTLLDTTVLSLIDFNINNQNESFDAFTGTPWVADITDAQTGLTAGQPDVSGNVTVNLGPASMFGIGIDDCASSVSGECSGPPGANEDQVRIGYISVDVDEDCLDPFGCGGGNTGIVPVPASLPLLGTALLVGGFIARRRRNAA